MIEGTWKDIMDCVFELDKEIVVIVGYADISDKYFKNLNEDSYWRLLGSGDDTSIVNSLNEWLCEVDCDGEYEFKAILKWGADYYLEVVHIEYNFIQTFIQREREYKLDNLFDLFE